MKSCIKLLIFFLSLILASCANKIVVQNLYEEKMEKHKKDFFFADPGLNLSYIVDSNKIPEPITVKSTMTRPLIKDLVSEEKIEGVGNATKKYIEETLSTIFPPSTKYDGQLTVNIMDIKLSTYYDPPFCMSVLDCMLKDYPAEADAFISIEFIYNKDDKALYHETISRQQNLAKNLDKGFKGMTTPMKLGQVSIAQTVNLILQEFIDDIRKLN